MFKKNFWILSILILGGCTSNFSTSGQPQQSGTSTPTPTQTPNPSPTSTPTPKPTPTPIFTPTPPPTPTPTPTPYDTTQNFWFVPEPGSDVVEMFERPDLWPTARSKMSVFGILSNYMYDNCQPVCKNNTWDRLVNAQVFSKLKQWNIPVFISVGSVKPDIHCDAKIYARDAVDVYIKKIKDQGGQVTGFTMDWPLASGKLDCGQQIDQTADYVVEYVNKVKAGYTTHHPGGSLQIGLWEGSPTFSADQIIQWMDLLQSKGYKPHHFVADFDHARFRRERRVPEMKNNFKKLKTYFKQKGILFGVALWGNDLRSIQTYHNQVNLYASEIRDAIGAADFIQVISWEYWNQKQNVGDVFPYNLPETDPQSHTSLFLKLFNYFSTP